VTSRDFHKQIVLSIPLNLAGKLYKTSLIDLDGQGIDVILGMSWMKEHKAMLHTASHIVHLNSPEHGIVILQPSSPPVPNPSVHHTTAKSLEDIPVACEFPYVFPNDLPGITLDRDVEFTIELQ
jgi:hypothetical protein